MRTTFENINDRKDRERAENHVRGRAKDFKAFMSAQDLEETHLDGEIYSFYDYGLGFDFVEAGTFDDQNEGYYRYQLSWGGPSEEIRFYHSKEIEFVFLDWGIGVGFDLTGKDWAQWLLDWFTQVGSIDWDSIPYESRIV